MLLYLYTFSLKCPGHFIYTPPCLKTLDALLMLEIIFVFANIIENLSFNFVFIHWAIIMIYQWILTFFICLLKIAFLSFFWELSFLLSQFSLMFLISYWFVKALNLLPVLKIFSLSIYSVLSLFLASLMDMHLIFIL